MLSEAVKELTREAMTLAEEMLMSGDGKTVTSFQERGILAAAIIRAETERRKLSINWPTENT